MNKRFKSWAKEIYSYRTYILISIPFIIASFILNDLAGNYVSYFATAQVPDLILDHIGPMDWNFSFVYVSLSLMVVLYLYPALFRVPLLHRALIQVSLLETIRAFFITLTHLQTPLDAMPVKFPGSLSILVFSNDSFFSGHTAFPFLGFLLFKDSKIRWLFLAGSIYMGITVLISHRHYSIDVFSAFFITYGSYKIGNFIINKIEKFLKKD